MKRALLLAALSTALTLVLSSPMMAQSTSASAGASAPAQNAACDEVQDRLNAGDDNLTSAELLACGLNPEAINPCEGNPDPNCGASLPEGAYPSINGPDGVGADNACSGLPEGSPEAVACYEDLIGTASPGASSSASASVPSSAPALPETGGPAPAFALVPLALLLGTGLLALGMMRRG